MTALEKNIYGLKLHESLFFKNKHSEFVVTRVASGWIYSELTDTAIRINTFVPFDNEFMEENNL